MFRPGSIRKVQVTNFVTYTHVDFHPGPQLNMILGPNGTGKSTLVAAIILGLGGNPKTVGRGKKISEYVKHDCDEAIISIYLEGKIENDFVKITRRFQTNDTSSWYLNDKKITLNGILKVIKEFNIQVDNLCQFLPQDRLQDFAKLNSTQLLRETQLALCRYDLIEKYDQLLQYQKIHDDTKQKMDRENVRLQQAQEINSRLEGKVANYEKKKSSMKKIDDCDRKIAWLEFSLLKLELDREKEEVSRASEGLQDCKNNCVPLESKILSANNVINDISKVVSAHMRELNDIERKVQENIHKLGTTQQSFQQEKNQLQLQITEFQHRAERVNEISAQVDSLQLNKTNLIAQLGTENEVSEKVNKLMMEIQKHKCSMKKIDEEKECNNHLRHNKMAEMRALTNEMERLQSVRQKRFDYLSRIDRDAFEAVQWLRSNQHLLKEKVYEPMIIEINVLENKNGIYLENVIPMRDLVAFVCVSRVDMSTMIRYLRKEKRLNVNIIFVDKDVKVSSFQPNISIAQLRRFGVYTYLNSLFTAPDPIMVYICKSYQVHNIPIGNHDTNQYYDQFPKQIRTFFSDNKKYLVKYSKYSNDKSVRQITIHSNGDVFISIDAIRLETVRGSIQEAVKNIGQIDNQILHLNSQVTKVNETVSKNYEELKNINTMKQQINTFDQKIANLRTRMDEIQHNLLDREGIENMIKEQAIKCARSIEKIHKKIISDLKQHLNSAKAIALSNMKLTRARKSLIYLETQIQDLRRQCEEAEEELKKFRISYDKLKQNARISLRKAKELSNGVTPEDEGFDEFRERYTSLPDNIEDVRKEKDSLLSRIDCLSTADMKEIEEYKSRQQEIEKMEGLISKMQRETTKQSGRFEGLKNEWLQPLQELVNAIHEKFSAAFQHMECLGEVSLSYTDEHNFESYGLCIKVSFRAGQEMQPLNNFIQSGGERAVTTATFLLSLQELTPVPFRCVDEINQGMDPNNERRIFNLLVESTSRPNTAQYFLITPKLVSNLKYSRNIVIHVVHNGPFVEPDKKWINSSLCNPSNINIM